MILDVLHIIHRDIRLHTSAAALSHAQNTSARTAIGAARPFIDSPAVHGQQSAETRERAWYLLTSEESNNRPAECQIGRAKRQRRLQGVFLRAPSCFNQSAVLRAATDGQTRRTPL